ncbi:hypothetical protein BYT27DRAFT_6834835 [Phlegmacium glaucopus]|nr:hypothetical protein BYT27DRAFT_6834835 [Phlegmacium glaucopus]
MRKEEDLVSAGLKFALIGNNCFLIIYPVKQYSHASLGVHSCRLVNSTIRHAMDKIRLPTRSPDDQGSGLSCQSSIDFWGTRHRFAKVTWYL